MAQTQAQAQAPRNSLQSDPRFEVTDDEACIKAALVAYGGIPMICQEKGKREKKEYKENLRRLVQIVNDAGGTLILRKPLLLEKNGLTKQK
jgi:hypothetical protein